VEHAREQIGLQPDEHSPLVDKVSEVCEALSIEWDPTSQNSSSPLRRSLSGGDEEAALPSSLPEAAPVSQQHTEVEVERNAVQMLVMVTGMSEDDCSQALVAAGGNIQQASVALLQPDAENGRAEGLPVSLTLEEEDDQEIAAAAAEHAVPSSFQQQQPAAGPRPTSPARSPGAFLSEAMNRLCEGFPSKAAARDHFRRIDKVTNRLRITQQQHSRPPS
jgi:hypothetical protein